MQLTIKHRTLYRYDAPVTYALQQLRMTPKDRPGQQVKTWTIDVTGADKQTEYDDCHMNHVTLVSRVGSGQEIEIVCSGTVETQNMDGVTGKHGGFAPLWLFLKSTDLTRAGTLTRRLARGLNSDQPDAVARMHELSARILDAVPYTPGRTDAKTSAEDALAAGHGVCQDHTHIFVAAARSLGLPARYVSGYLMMDDQTDQEASHAWAETHIDGLGWVGFDVSNGISPDERYVRVATGLDYLDAAPIHGLSFGDISQEELQVEIQVQQ